MSEPVFWISPLDELPKASQDVIAIDVDGYIETGFYSIVDEDNHKGKENLHDWVDFHFPVMGWIPRPEFKE